MRQVEVRICEIQEKEGVKRSMRSINEEIRVGGIEFVRLRNEEEVKK